MKLVPDELWSDLVEFLEELSDVKDGPEPTPNRAMSLLSRVEEEGLAL